MKDFLRLALLFALLAAVAVLFVHFERGKGWGLKVGQPAPDFKLAKVEGGVTSLSGLRGRVVLVNLWASWCAPCLEEMPSLERMHRSLKPEGLVVLGVSADKDLGAMLKVVKDDGLSFEILRDPDGVMANAYHATGYPETYLVDRNGVLRDAFIGPVAWDAPESIARIRRVLDDRTSG